MQEALDDTALRLNSVAIHLVRRARAADGELGVPPGQLSALSVIVFGGARTIAELAEAEHVTSPTMTRIVDGLERAGLAQRRRHPTDRRSNIVSATARGRRLMHRGRDRRVAVIADVLQGLDGEELAAVRAAVIALGAALARGDRRV